MLREISDIQDIQRVLHGLLRHLKTVCRAHGLTFFLSNGTLLGAAKYGDFIPWDDDIDILMPREDYDKLLQLTDIQTDTYALLSSSNFPRWRMPYAKLTDTRTLLQEGTYDFGAELGVAIDIFPIDNWHPCRPVAAFQAIHSELLKRLLVASNSEQFYTDKRGVKKIILCAIWRTGQRLGHQTIRERIERRAIRSHRHPPVHVGCVVWTCHSYHEVLPASVFATQKQLPFGGEDFPVPGEYAIYLSHLYGDWRQELPPEKQVSNHNIKVWWKYE